MNKLTERIVSVLSYSTFGFFSIIWLIYVNVAKKSMSQFLVFNIYQAIFISVFLAVISLVYEIAFGFMSAIPILGGIVKIINSFINETPIYFTYTLSSLLIMILLAYLCIMSILGKPPYIPLISKMIRTNFGV